jgi:hypothetical protein
MKFVGKSGNGDSVLFCHDVDADADLDSIDFS